MDYNIDSLENGYLLEVKSSFGEGHDRYVYDNLTDLFEKIAKEDAVHVRGRPVEVNVDVEINKIVMGELNDMEVNETESPQP